VECVDITRIKRNILHICESVIKVCATSINGRNGLHYLEISVAIVMLWEVQYIGWPVVADGDIDAGHLIKADIMITDSQDNGHEITNGRGQRSIELKVVIPCIGTGRHIIIIGDVTSDEKYIRLESGDDFG
jgi:hypothetical protein